jgi:hypothetical protein
MEPQQEWIESKQRRHHQNATIAVLDVGCLDDGIHQPSLRIE